MELPGKVMNAISGSSLFQAIMANLCLVFLGTSITNDWPMIAIGSLAMEEINTLPSTFKNLLAYTAVLGTDLGALVIPSSSLSTLIWMGIIRRMTQTEVSWGQYIRVGIIVTPFTLLAAALILWVQALFFIT